MSTISISMMYCSKPCCRVLCFKLWSAASTVYCSDTVGSFCLFGVLISPGSGHHFWYICIIYAAGGWGMFIIVQNLLAPVCLFPMVSCCKHYASWPWNSSLVVLRCSRNVFSQNSHTINANCCSLSCEVHSPSIDKDQTLHTSISKANWTTLPHTRV